MLAGKIETKFLGLITETDIMIMSIEAFKTDAIVFIGDVIMCFTSD
jgi:hypothetical protein